MTIIESRDALKEALLNIGQGATERGMKVETKCFIADHDLTELSEDNLSSAALIAGEIAVGSDENEEKILLECALSITDGEVAPDEMLREVNTLRESMKEILDKYDEVGNVKDTLDSFAKELDVEAPPVRTFDNKNFYIGGAIVVAVILILIMFLK